MDESEFLMNLKREFLEKAPMELDGWEGNLLGFEKTGERTLTEDLMRKIHSMKGSAQAVGLAELAALLHELERFLLQSLGSVSNSELVSVVLSFIDHLRGYLEADASASGDGIRKMKAILSV